MQGKKEYQERLFLSFQLSDYVPEDNFYRRLKSVLNLDYLYALTKDFYGLCGQKSIDPVVFFKLCLVGYLENLISDRQLISHCKMRMDILYFLDFNIDEPLPWHSTLSRTRQLYPEEVFEEVFTDVLQKCISKGMVLGKTQVVDSAPIKANASMDSLELKVPEQDLEDYLHEIRHISKIDKKPKPIRRAKVDKSSREQQVISASREELQSINSRNKRWRETQDQRPGAGNRGSKYTSNKTHYSPTDPDARISVKPGKARKLNYLSQLSVDSANHVITDIKAYHADGKDNQQLQDITLRLKQRLWREGFGLENLLADTGYSSGENYAFLEEQGIKSFIPPHGTYKGGPNGFVYDEELDSYTCPKGEEIPFKKVFKDYRTQTLKREYRGSTKQCRDCPIRKDCLGKTAKEKKFSVTYYKSEYERNIKRVNSKQGQYYKKKRSSTVEPVFGTLTQHLGLRKINTKGLNQANKVMLMSAIAYNLKKYLKFTQKKAKVKVKRGQNYKSLKNPFSDLLLSFLNYPKWMIG